MGTYKDITDFGVNPENYNEVASLHFDFTGATQWANYNFRPLFTTKDYPDVFGYGYDASNSIIAKPFAMLQLPVWLQISDTSMEDITLKQMLIRVNDPDDHDLIDEIVKSLTTEIDNSTVTVSSQYQIIESNNKALNLLDIIFEVIIGIMMFLCFFALQSAMTANIYNQTKEIAVMRSIGFTGYRISTLYFYEAMLLVFASSLLGICIGVAVGFTMVL